MARKKQDEAFIEVVQEKNLLDAEKIRLIAEEQRAAAKNGVEKSLAQIALEHDFLSENELENVETEMWIKALPDRLDDYELEQLIGRGGMAAVFRGRDVSLGKVVAVKVLLPQFAASTTYLARFHREARLAAKLSHPNTVQALRVGNHEGIHYLVLEFVEGRSASAMLRERGRLDEVEALDVAIGVAESLQEAHDQGIIHRDVKPSNIIVSRWGVAKLTDFGIAKQVSDITDERLQRSLTMGVVGTPQYMSPEQVRGAKDIDFRTDVYSLGASLYHMVVGHPPHDAQSPQEAMYRVASTDPVDPQTRRPDLTSATCDLICQMMARKPEDRFPDFRSLIDALKAARREAAARAAKRLETQEAQTLGHKPTVGPPAGATPAADGAVDNEGARISLILLTAGLVVILGTALILGLPHMKGCQAAKPPSPTGLP